MEHLFIPYTAQTLLEPANVLVLAPHPDDEVFGCGGAIIRHRQQGHSVRVVIVTDGSAAVAHPDETARAAYIASRQQESNAAAAILGCDAPEFWGIPDRQLVADEAFIQRLVEYFQQHQIQRVYTTSPWEVHPDHHALAQAVISAAQRYEAALQLCFYEIGVPLFPNLLIDISDIVQLKIQAMACFPSQSSLHDYTKFIRGLNQFRTWTLAETVDSAEAYFTIENEKLRANSQAAYGVHRQTAYLHTLHTQNAQLQNENQHLAHELAAVYQSTSWRVTAPLRWVKRWWLSYNKKM